MCMKNFNIRKKYFDTFNDILKLAIFDILYTW